MWNHRCKCIQGKCRGLSYMPSFWRNQKMGSVLSSPPKALRLWDILTCNCSIPIWAVLVKYRPPLCLHVCPLTACICHRISPLMYSLDIEGSDRSPAIQSLCLYMRTSETPFSVRICSHFRALRYLIPSNVSLEQSKNTQTHIPTGTGSYHTRIQLWCTFMYEMTIHCR